MSPSLTDQKCPLFRLMLSFECALKRSPVVRAKRKCVFQRMALRPAPRGSECAYSRNPRAKDPGDLGAHRSRGVDSFAVVHSNIGTSPPVAVATAARCGASLRAALHPDGDGASCAIRCERNGQKRRQERTGSSIEAPRDEARQEITTAQSSSRSSSGEN